MLDTVGPSEAVLAFGAQIRSLRRQRGMTLKELGRRAGLSHPFLSQLERGLARPSFSSTERIAGALDVPVGTLWSQPTPSGHTTIVRRDGGAAWRHHEASAPGDMRKLSPECLPLDVREWTGGSHSWPPGFEVASGAVVLYVARGSLEVDLDGEVHALDEGDTMMFDGTVPHRFRRTGAASTRVLRVAAPLPA